MFTKELIKEIEYKLSLLARKDTSFELALELSKNDKVAIVQNNKNKIISIGDIITHLHLLGSTDFVNVTSKFNESYITLNLAILLIPFISRKIGQLITFLDKDGHWQIYQFKGTNKNQWNNITLWENVISTLLDSKLEADEEDITTKKRGDKYQLKFKDKEYNKEEFSGLGKVILRKNVSKVMDPTEGKPMFKNLLTQPMFKSENTTYVIRYDYSLNGGAISLPKNSTLEFDGGSIVDGKIEGRNTRIINSTSNSFINIETTGTWNTELSEPIEGEIKTVNVVRDIIANQDSINNIENNIDNIEEDIKDIDKDLSGLHEDFNKLPKVDEEDITVGEDNLIKFKDKEYSDKDYSGLGRVYLRKNIVANRNILTQEMINKPNTIYIIQYDYDLSQKEITIPENCVLDFYGGSFNNGEIIFNETFLKNNFRIYCKVSGSVKNNSINIKNFLESNNLNVVRDRGIYNLEGVNIINFEPIIYNVDISLISFHNPITFSNKTLLGNGCIVTTEDLKSTIGTLFTFRDCENIEMNNFKLNGAITPEITLIEGGRHNIDLNNCKNVRLNNIVSEYANTDGLYISGDSENVIINNFDSNYNGRQGCSIISAKDVYIRNSKFRNTSKYPPMSGIDLEPNYEYQNLENINIERCMFFNNTSSGIIINMNKLKNRPLTSINIHDCVFNNNSRSISITGNKDIGSGYIRITNCLLLNSKATNFQLKSYSSENTPYVILNNCVIHNANLNNGEDIREHRSLLSIHNISSSPVESKIGNIKIIDCMFKQDDIITENINSCILLYDNKAAGGVSNVEINNPTFKTSLPYDSYYGNISLFNYDIDLLKINVEYKEITTIAKSLQYCNKISTKLHTNLKASLKKIDGEIILYTYKNAYFSNIKDNALYSFGLDYTAEDKIFGLIKINFIDNIPIINIVNGGVVRGDSIVYSTTNTESTAVSELMRNAIMYNTMYKHFNIATDKGVRDIYGFLGGHRHKGSTQNRPILNTDYDSFIYYDTTLSKYIVWTGILWVNLDGTNLE